MTVSLLKETVSLGFFPRVSPIEFLIFLAIYSKALLIFFPDLAEHSRYGNPVSFDKLFISS